MHGFSALPGRRAESRLYTWGALLALLVVFAGFARTFYLTAIFETPTLSGLLFTHGVLMSLWFVLFFTQGWLVAKGRTDLHRCLGVGGVALAFLIVGVSVATAIDAGRRGASPAEGVPPLVFMAIPMGDVVVFSILLGVGLWLRRRPDDHKRLMLLATLSILTPGIACCTPPSAGGGRLGDRDGADAAGRGGHAHVGPIRGVVSLITALGRLRTSEQAPISGCCSLAGFSRLTSACQRTC